MPALSVIGAAVGNYRIIAPLGVGATGAVYLAEQPLLGRRVAVKILHPRRAEDGPAVRTFLADTGAVRALAHPHVAEILEVANVTTPAGELPCVVMELLEGQTLAELLADRKPLAPIRALMVAEQIAEALVAAHAQGLVHGDLKAENIFLITEIPGLDSVKVLDFGVWRFRPPHGTTAYLAPEQCVGDDADAQADMYALGALLFEMLTGEPPMAPAGLGEMVIAHLFSHDGPPRPSQRRSSVPVSLDPIVVRALEKHPARRFPTMTAMLAALRNPMDYDIALESPVVPVDIVPPPVPPAVPPQAPTRPTPAPRSPPEQRRGAFLSAIAAAAAAVLAIATVAASAGGSPCHTAHAQLAVADPAADTVALMVGSCAPNARIFLDDVDVGPIGQTLQVPRGRAIVVTVKAPGFLPFSSEVVPEDDVTIEAVLVPRAPEPSNI